MRHTKLILTLFCLLVCLVGPAAAASRATLNGTLLDSDGAPLRGVEVTIRGGEFEKAAKTDKKGRFKVVVPDSESEYEIRFVREGFPAWGESLTFGGSDVLEREWTMNATPLGAATGSMTALNAYNAGVQAYNDGDYELALRKLGEAAAEDPEFVEAHALIAGTHRKGGNLEQASSSAERVLALDADNVEALRILYYAQRELGHESAGATLDRLAEADASPSTAILVYNDGVVARAAGDRDRARSRYETATRLDPSFVKAHAALAGLLLEVKEYDAALAGSERTLELDPQDVRGNSIRYNALIALGRDEDAKAMLDQLQQVAPGAVAQAYYERGTLLFDDGQTDLAIAALERAVGADPKLARAHYWLGLCFMNKNRREDARRHLETFLELAPNDPEAGTARQMVELLSRAE